MTESRERTGIPKPGDNSHQREKQTECAKVDIPGVLAVRRNKEHGDHGKYGRDTEYDFFFNKVFYTFHILLRLLCQMIFQNCGTQTDKRTAWDLALRRALTELRLRCILRESKKFAADNAARDSPELCGTALYALIQRDFGGFICGITVTVEHAEHEGHGADSAADLVLTTETAAERTGDLSCRRRIKRI
jgi:hypothetical protein